MAVELAACKWLFSAMMVIMTVTDLRMSFDRASNRVRNSDGFNAKPNSKATRSFFPSSVLAGGLSSMPLLKGGLLGIYPWTPPLSCRSLAFRRLWRKRRASTGLILILCY